MIKKLLLIIGILLIATNCWAANRYWVGGGSSANWNATGNTNWGTASNTQDNASVPGLNDDVFFDGVGTGASDSTLSASCTVNSLNFSGYANTLTHNASVTLTIDGQDGGGDSLIMAAGMTYTFTAATSRITFTGAGTSDITCAGITLPNVTFNNSGDTFSILDTLLIGGTSTTALYLQAGTFTHNNNAVTLNGTTPTIRGAFSFHTLNRTGTAVKTDTLVLYNDITVTNTLNLDGNSALNRVLVTSVTLGTPITLTVTGATVTGCTNCDFRDIAFVSTGAVDLTNSGANWIGDCGGNSISGGGTLTMTTADDWYWNGSGTQNFSDYTYWYTATNGGGSQMASTRCVLPQDNCFFDADSIDGATTVDQDMPRVCKTLDFTGVDAMAFHTNNINQTLYGSLIYVSNVTITVGYPGSGSWLFEGRGAFDIYCIETSLGGATIQAIGGTYTARDNFTSGSRNFNINYGTFDANDFNVTCGGFDSSNANVRKILMGSGTWTVSRTYTSSGWSMATITNLDLGAGFAESSTIVFIIGDGTATVTFAGGGLEYNNLTINSGTNIATISGSNTFNVFTINAPKTVKFTSGTTQTVNSLVATGSAGNNITLQSTVVDTIATISDANGGTNENDYLDVLDIVANELNTFYYGANGSADAESTNWLASPTGVAKHWRSLMGVGR